MNMAVEALTQILNSYDHEILDQWLELQLKSVSARRDLISDRELRSQSSTFLNSLKRAAAGGQIGDLNGPAYQDVRGFLASLSASRASQGFSPSETATFVFSLKQPLFVKLRSAMKDPDALQDAIWQTNEILDKLGLLTMEYYMKGREEVIQRQSQEMLELSTPVVKLWDNILALPLIGTLDSARTQVVMESLLQEIVNGGVSIAIIDITGVPTVDTLVAQHLLKTVAAARLMGADCIVSGIRPQIAQTIVHLGVQLGEVTTKASLADAFSLALKKVGARVVPIAQ